jgi:acetyl-CoA carboxylase carboxyltransferase component
MAQKSEQYGINELAERTKKALAMGGPDKIERQHGKGLLTVRERIEKLVDPGTFDELGLLLHSDLADAADKTPADGKVCGFGKIDGRTVMVAGDDVTVKAGAGGRMGVAKTHKWDAIAGQKGYPLVHLGEAGGARLPDIMGSAGMMSMTYPIEGEARDRRVPMIATIMGECYGGPSWIAAISDIVIQVKEKGIMAVAAPRILEVATSEISTPEELGGWQLHARKTGQVDLFAEDEEDCLRLVRRSLSYFPNNCEEFPPVAPCDILPGFRTEFIYDAVPSNPRRGYDMHNAIKIIFDPNTMLELKPYYDGSLITCLARLDGHVVGVFANNPMVNAGAMGPGACEKATSFICLCDSFNIPLVFLNDTPGFLVGKAAEEQKMPLKIMQWIQALQKSTVPRVSVMVRKSYGMAHCNMSGGGMGSFMLLAWPTAEVSFMAPDVAVNVVFGGKMKDMEMTDELRRQFHDELVRGSEPWEAAGLGFIDKIIDPADTRKELIKALNYARGPKGDQGKSRRLLAGWPRMF